MRLNTCFSNLEEEKKADSADVWHPLASHTAPDVTQNTGKTQGWRVKGHNMS